MTDATDPHDPYWTPGPGKVWGIRAVLGLLGAMALLIALHLAFAWPA